MFAITKTIIKYETRSLWTVWSLFKALNSSVITSVFGVA